MIKRVEVSVERFFLPSRMRISLQAWCCFLSNTEAYGKKEIIDRRKSEASSYKQTNERQIMTSKK